MKNSFLIVDYNNIRFTDVLKMKNYLKNVLGLTLCLIRPSPQAIDFDIADDVFDLDLTDPQFVQNAIEGFNRADIFIVGGFPFSDKAVEPGTKLLKTLNLKSDSAALARAAASKWNYRLAEKQFQHLLIEQGVFIPRSTLLRDRIGLHSLVREYPCGIVLKPTHEGNNRGVSIVESPEDADRAWSDAQSWFNQGLIAEELIPFQPEYSHDGVAHLDFVTQKVTQEGRYPVECGQIVSSEIDGRIVQRIKKTGQIVNAIAGSSVGAFHNEIRIHPKTLVTAVVEPNRRPAGMCIWDLAEKVYRLSFYQLLIDSALGRAIPHNLPEPQGTAAIRMLRVLRTGTLSYSIEDILKWTNEIAAEFSPQVELFQFRLLKKSGDFASHQIKNNGDFVAQICAFGPNAATVEAALANFEQRWLEKTLTWVSEKEVAI